MLYSVLELLPCALHHAAGDLHTAESTDVLSDPARERFGDALAILGGFEPARVAWIADKRNLGQNRDGEIYILTTNEPKWRCAFSG